MRLRSMGDLVLETPVIAALHAWRPDLRILVLAEPRFAALFEGNPHVSEIFFSDSFARTALALRRRRFPIVYNQHGGPRSAFLTAASGAHWRVCWERFQFSALYNVHAPDSKEFCGTPAVHTVEHRISQFYWTGLPRGPIPRARVFPQPDAVASVAQVLAQNGIAPGDPYAVLQPGARLPAMRWPVNKFAPMARWLLETRGIPCVVNLSERDADVATEANREMRDCAILPEPFNLRELIALVAGASFFLGNDSGPAHLAAAVGLPCVVVFGPTNPVHWRPWQTTHRVVQTGATFKSLRGDKSIVTHEPRSIQSISVGEMREACEDLLEEIRVEPKPGAKID